MSRIAKITTIVLVCGITLSAAAYFLRDTAVAGVVMNKVNTYRLNQGLVGWWTFDGQDVNWKTGRVSDRLGNNNYGTIENMSTSTSPVPGKVGQALQFDGVNDEVDSPNPFNGLDSSASATFTWSWWQKTNQDNNGHMIGWGSGRFCSMGFISGYVACTVDSDANGGVISLTTLADNQWHHVVYTHSPGSQTLYVDGVLNDTANETFVTGAGDIDVGVRPFGIYWQGALDDVRIYNRALSPSEIKLLYTSTAGSKMNTSKNVIPGSTLQTGLVGLWSFDGPDLTDKVYDRSGQGNHGYFNGGATSSAKVAGKVGQALRFDGVDDNVTLGDINFLDGATAFSVSIWVNQDSFPAADRTIISKHANSPKHFSFFTSEPGNGGVDDMELALTSSAGSIDCYAWTTTNVHEARQWEFWTVVFDGTQSGNANRVSMYKNGTPQTLTFGGTCPASTVSNGNVVRVGSDADLSPGFFWNGQLDDVRIYNRALSASEVKDLYTATAGTKVNTSQNVVPGSTLQQGLVGLWSFNGPDLNSRTNTAYDRSGQGNNGEMVNMSTSTSRVPGKVGQALQFDGVDDYVEVNGNSSLNSLPAMSISVWMNPKSFGEGGQGMIASKSLSYSEQGWRLQLHYASDYLQFFVPHSGTDLTVYSSDSTVVLNEWSHWVITWGGSISASSVHIYKNGQEVTGSGTSATGSRGSDSGVLAIGDEVEIGNTRSFDGILDEVRVYNRILTPAEVKLLYNLGR